MSSHHSVFWREVLNFNKVQFINFFFIDWAFAGISKKSFLSPNILSKIFSSFFLLKYYSFIFYIFVYGKSQVSKFFYLVCFCCCCFAYRCSIIPTTCVERLFFLPLNRLCVFMKKSIDYIYMSISVLSNLSHWLTFTIDLLSLYCLLKLYSKPWNQVVSPPGFLKKYSLCFYLFICNLIFFFIAGEIFSHYIEV